MSLIPLRNKRFLNHLFSSICTHTAAKEHLHPNTFHHKPFARISPDIFPTNTSSRRQSSNLATVPKATQPVPADR